MNESQKVKSNEVFLSGNRQNTERRYSFVQIINKPDEKLTIRYEFKLSLLKNKSGEQPIFQINRITPVSINNKIPDLVVDELAYEAGKVLYPLSVFVEESGAFKQVANYQEIVERWHLHKQKITEYFIGETVEKYLLLMDENIQSESDLNKIFRHDLFISTFFAPVYKTYSFNCCKDNITYFPLGNKNSPVKFKVDEVLSEFLTEDGNVEINHNGVSIDERSFHEIDWGYDEATGEMEPAEITYDARYMLEESTGLIQTANVKWMLKSEQPKVIEIHICRLGKVTAPERQTKKTQPDKSEIKEKGFFKELWDVLRS